MPDFIPATHSPVALTEPGTTASQAASTEAALRQALAAAEQQLAATRQQLTEQREFYEGVLNALAVNVAVYDADLRFCFVNSAAIRDPAVREWALGKTNEDYCAHLRLPTELAAAYQGYCEEARRTRAEVRGRKPGYRARSAAAGAALPAAVWARWGAALYGGIGRGYYQALPGRAAAGRAARLL